MNVMFRNVAKASLAIALAAGFAACSDDGEPDKSQVIKPDQEQIANDQFITINGNKYWYDKVSSWITTVHYNNPYPNSIFDCSTVTIVANNLNNESITIGFGIVVDNDGNYIVYPSDCSNGQTLCFATNKVSIFDNTLHPNEYLIASKKSGNIEFKEYNSQTGFVTLNFNDLALSCDSPSRKYIVSGTMKINHSVHYNM